MCSLDEYVWNEAYDNVPIRYYKNPYNQVSIKTLHIMDKRQLTIGSLAILSLLEQGHATYWGYSNAF